MTATQKRILAFTCGVSMVAVIAWLGWFDFDHRSPNVAMGAAIAVIFGVIAATYPYENS